MSNVFTYRSEEAVDERGGGSPPPRTIPSHETVEITVWITSAIIIPS
jgi:hypothetical protein